MKLLRRILRRKPPRVTFEMSQGLPADDDLAVWITSLARSLNDVRTAARFAVRQKQPAHERLYFVRVLASHIREAFKVVILEHQDRKDVQDFVSRMTPQGRNALDELRSQLDAPLESRGDVTLFEAIKDLRDDTFHYAREKNRPSVERTREALRRSGGAGEEGVYLLADKDHRAVYADLVDSWLVHPFDGKREENEGQARELHQAILELIGPLSTFIQTAEAQWLSERPAGVVTWPRAHHLR